MIPKRKGRKRVGAVGDGPSDDVSEDDVPKIDVVTPIELDVGPDAVVKDEVGGVLDEISSKTEDLIVVDPVVSSKRPMRKAKAEAEKRRSMIVKELKGSGDELDILDDDDDEDDEAMYMTGDVEDDWLENEEAIKENAAYEEAEAQDKAEKEAEEKGQKVVEKPTKVCHVCGHKAQSYVSLRNHIMARHEKKKPFLCEICGYAATLESTVERHKRIKHAEGKGAMKYQCPTCDYKCTTPMHLKGHEIIVHQEGATPFECGVCAYQCRRKPTVLKHMKYVHEGAKPFTCPHCERKYPKQCVLNKHIENVHDKVRPYACDLCGHPFAEKRYLEKHIKVVHEKIKEIKCELCDYRCALPYNLQDHMFNKHTRERPHACGLCNERFLKYGRLAAHMKEKHGQPFRPYKCDKCDYGTDKKNRLAKHKVVEHATMNKMLRCKECGTRFRGEKRLAEHMMREHQKQPTSYVVKKPVEEEEDGTSLDAKAANIIAENSAASQLEQHIKDLTQDVSMEDFQPLMKRPKLEPVYTEGEMPGETIEVVGADDDIWNDEGRPLVERRKSLHFNKVDPELLRKAREEEIARGGKPVTTRFVVTTKRGDIEEPVIFEIEIREEIAATVSAERLEDDTRTAMDLLAGIESNGIMDQILTNVNIQEKEVTDADAKMERIVRDRVKAEVANTEEFEEQTGDITFEGAFYESEEEKRKKKLQKKVFLCDECGYSCNAMHTLTLHRTFKHGPMKEELESGVTRQCDQCDYTCVHPQHLEAHRQIVHEDNVAPMQCESCPFQSRGEREMNTHMRALHDDVKPFACKHCDRVFSKKSNMVKHAKMVHDKIKPYSCDECGRCFADKRDVKAHVDAVHRKLRPFACHLCDARCARKSQLKVHINNVHASQKPIFECGECAQRFINKNLLNLHNKAVHTISLRAFQCQYCDFSCPTRAMIESHQRRKHTKEKVACHTCGIDFMSDRKLQAHIRLEHESGGNDPGAKNCVCDWCDYAGATQVHLTNHVKSVHENVRRHKCMQCDFTSYATTALKRHIAAVHERKKPYGCSECNFRTAYKDSLELHLTNVHGAGPRKIRSGKRLSERKDDHLNEDQLAGPTTLTVLRDDGTELAVDTEMGVITVGGTVIVGDVIQTVDAKDVEQAETVAATEDLMTLVGYGAGNVVQQE